MLKKIGHIIFGRPFIFSLLIILQLALIVIGATLLIYYYWKIVIVLQALSLIIVISIISKRDNPMYKISWIIPILLFPLFGGLFYLLFGKHKLSCSVRRHLQETATEIKRVFEQHIDCSPAQELEQLDPGVARQSYYLRHQANAPVYKNTYTQLLTPGERKLDAILEELAKAEKYIFLEYFIVHSGVFWDSVFEILKQKASEGVTVRLMYDDVGCITTLPSGFDKKLRECGIDCKIFNPFRPSIDAFMNFRDHRKICIVDGNVAITGGINIGDEYINHHEHLTARHGHWKDSAILLKGDAVWSLTILFLQIWEHLSPDHPSDYLAYKPTVSYPSDGYVQPFGDSPIDASLVSETTYMNMIHDAKRYVYIQTPYLILDNEMLTTLCIAAQSGIDVRIITPHIPDKWFVHSVTRANYDALVEAGVKVFEYTPGFIHAKTMVSDDKVAVIGTANFDFRSFYLHFECGVFLYGSSSVLSLRDDFLETQEKSTQVTLAHCLATSFPRRIARAILRVFSPLM